MTLVPNFKKCKKCGAMYDYNPDVGITILCKNMCPKCIEKMIVKKKTNKNAKK